MSRGQVSVEFLLVMGFATVILLAFLFVVLYVQDAALADQERAVAERIASEIRQELVTASVVMDGYTRTLVIPERAINRDVAVAARPQGVWVRVGSQEVVVRTPAYSGEPSLGTNTLRRVGGEVFFV